LTFETNTSEKQGTIAFVGKGLCFEAYTHLNAQTKCITYLSYQCLSMFTHYQALLHNANGDLAIRSHDTIETIESSGRSPFWKSASKMEILSDMPCRSGRLFKRKPHLGGNPGQPSGNQTWQWKTHCQWIF
jgi:hypothetical protein